MWDCMEGERVSQACGWHVWTLKKKKNDFKAMTILPWFTMSAVNTSWESEREKESARKEWERYARCVWGHPALAWKTVWKWDRDMLPFGLWSTAGSGELANELLEETCWLCHGCHVCLLQNFPPCPFTLALRPHRRERLGHVLEVLLKLSASICL